MLLRPSARRPDPREALTVPQESELVVRRPGFSVPFNVNALLPLYRTASPESQPLVQSLQEKAQEVAATLQRLLAPQTS